jgi:SAM-dependent methyltransferase
MTGALEWEGGVGRAWAAEWQRTDRSFAPLTARLLDAIAALPGQSIVDIGCGAGELSLALADARPEARVLGLDISAELVATATMRARGRANCAFAVADAAAWTPDRGVPDLYVSRHGVMFFADPVAAFAHLADIAARDAGLCFSCFRSAAENPWASGIAALLPSASQSDPHAPGPFAFADPHRMRGILERAGWGEARFEPVDFRYLAGAGADAVADALGYFAQIGPAARAMRALPEAERASFGERLRGFVADHCANGEVAFSAAAWIVTAAR